MAANDLGACVMVVICGDVSLLPHQRSDISEVCKATTTYNKNISLVQLFFQSESTLPTKKRDVNRTCIERELPGDNRIRMTMVSGNIPWLSVMASGIPRARGCSVSCYLMLVLARYGVSILTQRLTGLGVYSCFPDR